MDKDITSVNHYVTNISEPCKDVVNVAPLSMKNRGKFVVYATGNNLEIETNERLSLPKYIRVIMYINISALYRFSG